MSAIVDVSVAYEEDVDHAITVLEGLCSEFGRSNQDVAGTPQVLGVHALGASEVVIRIFAQTKPMEQWKVERELRRAIKKVFDREGIEIPYPRQVLVPFVREGGSIAGKKENHSVKNVMEDLNKIDSNSEKMLEQRRLG